MPNLLLLLVQASAPPPPPPATVSVAADNAALVYSPYNWLVGAGVARAINPGATWRTTVTGTTTVALTFDLSALVAPYPVVAVRLDGGAWTRYTVAASVSVAAGLSTAAHLVEVSFAASRQGSHRWTQADQRLACTGLTIDAGATVTAPARRPGSVLVYGDSISEGVRALGSASGDLIDNDATADYVAYLAAGLNAEVGVVAFGGSGMDVTNSDGVPPLPQSYAYLWAGQARAFTPPPTTVIYLEGQNDADGDTAVTTGLRTVISALLTSAPSSVHVVLAPLSGRNRATTQATVAGGGYTAAQARWIDTTAWINTTTDTTDGLHPTATAHRTKIAPDVIQAVRSAMGATGPLQPFARLVDVRSGGVVAASAHVTTATRTITLDAPLTGSVSVPASDAGTAAGHPLAPPAAPTLAATSPSPATGLAAGTYTVGATWTTPAAGGGPAAGETTIGATATITITAGQAIHATPTLTPVGATGSNVYLSTVAGGTILGYGASVAPGGAATLAAVGTGTGVPATNTAQPLSMGQAALAAAGTDDGTAPVPTIVEIGVAGPAGAISVRLRVTAVTRSYKDGAPMIDITGEGPLAGYAGVVIAHAYYPGCKLSDVLGATPGTIIPVATGTAGFLSPNGAIPYLGGLFSRAPGLPAWTGKPLLAVTPAVDASIAGISTNLETRGDTTLRALEAATKRMAGDYIAGDAYPIGYRGHYYEEAASLSTAGNSVVVGTIGGSPASGFTLDGNASTAVDETVMAHIVEASIETNSADTYGQVLFTGGKSNAGLPDGATITGLGLLNPIGTGDRTDYTTCLPIISYQVGDKTGGVAFFNNDGLLRPLLTGAGPVYSLYIDTTGSTIYIGTDKGVYSRSSDVRATHPWTSVGGVIGRVVRLAVQRDNGGGVHLFAHATPKDNSLHGIYQYPGPAGSLTGAGWDGWGACVLGAHVQDFVMTDYQTAWVLFDNDQGHVHQTAVGFGGSSPMTPYALPAGVRAFHLDRVITAGDGSHPARDSIWAMTKGDAQSAYFLPRTGTTWGPWTAADADGSLAAATPNGAEPTINGAVGLGITISGQYTAVFISTSQGLYWSATLDGKGWKSACGLNGLSGVSIAGVAAGQYQGLQGALETRFFAYNPKQFFYSSSDARYWRDLTKEELHLGPFFAYLAQLATNDLPSNAVITIGPMATSPIGNPANTHIQVTGANQDLPAGWYWQRRLDDCNDWSYLLVNGNASTDATLASGLTDLQTNTAVAALRAAGDVARVARRWLSENSVPARTLKVRCPLTTQEAALWAVRPGMLLPVNLRDQINQLSADGLSIVGTQVVHMVNALWWVIEVTIMLDESGGSLAYADLTLSTVLRKDKTTPADIAAGLQDQIKSLNAFGARP